MTWNRLALLRARDAPGTPAVLAGVVALATVLLTAVLTGAPAVLADGLRAAVAGAAPVARGVEVSVRRDAGDGAAVQDRLVRAALAEALRGTRPQVVGGAVAEPLAVDGTAQGPDGAPLRVVPWTAEALAGHARTESGRLPVAGAGVPEVALHAGAAAALGVSTGDRLRLLPPDTSGRPVDVAVVGTWRPADPADPYWLADPMEQSGTLRAGVLGPLALDPADAGRLAVRWTSWWRALPDPDAVRPQDLPRLAAATAALRTRLAGVPAAGGGPAAVTAGTLPALLDSLQQPQRRSLAAVAALVAVLLTAAVALAVLAAALLADARAAEALLLRARGASAAQRVADAARETLPAAVLGAVPAAAVAALVTRALGGDTAATGRAVPVALGAALAVGLLVAVLTETRHAAAARAARSGGGALSAGPARRAAVVGPAAGAGLAAAALLAGWQVRRAATAPLPGDAGADPVVLVALAVLLTAAAVLGVAVLVLLARPAAALERGADPVVALAGWHAARRAARPAAPVVVLLLATGTAVVAASAAATARDAAAGRAARLVAAPSVVSAVPPVGTPAAIGGDRSPAATAGLAAVPGVAAVTPVTVLDGTAGDAAVRLVGVDTGWDETLLGGARDLRSPLAAALLRNGADVAAAVDAAGPAGLPVGGRGTLEVGLPGGVGSTDGTAEADLLVVGRGGTLVAVPLGGVPAFRPVALRAVLPPGTRRVVGVAVRLPVAGDFFSERPGPARTTFALTGLTVGGRPLDLGPDAAGATTGVSAARPGALAVEAAPGELRFLGSLATGEGRSVSGAVLAANPSTPSVPLPAVLPQALATAVGAGPGSDVTVVAGGGDRVVTRVAGVAPELPEPLPDEVAAGAADVGVVGAFAAQQASVRGAPVLVDGTSLAVLDVLAGRTPRAVRQWWVRGPADAAALAAAAAPAVLPGAGPPTVTTRAGVEQALAADPLSAGLTRLLQLGAAGLVLVAVASVALGEVVAGRRRRGELAVLRALGLAPGDLRRLLRTEQLVVLGAALVTGTALGAALALLAAPVLAGPAVAAPVDVRLPPAALLAAPLAVAVIVAAGQLLRGRRAGRLDVAAVLREEVR